LGSIEGLLPHPPDTDFMAEILWTNFVCSPFDTIPMRDFGDFNLLLTEDDVLFGVVVDDDESDFEGTAVVAVFSLL
jgi:hypothetical protein